MREVGDFFGVGYDTIREWRSRGMPGEPKAFNLRDVARWRFDREAGQIMTRDQAAEAREAEVGFKRARARMKELEARKMEGELIPRADAEKRLKRFARAFVSIIDRVPNEIPSRLSGREPDEHAAILAEYIDALRDELADELERKA